MVEKLHLRCKARNVNYTSSPLSSELIQSSSFPDAIPALTRVPQWAYLNPTGVRSVHSLPSLPTQSFLIEPPVRFLECFIGTKYRRCVFVPTNHIFYVLYYRALSQVCPKLQAVPPMSQARLATSPLLRPGHLRVRRRHHHPRVARMLALSRGVSSEVSSGWP